MNHRVFLVSLAILAGVQWCAVAQETSETVAVQETPAVAAAATPAMGEGQSVDRPHQNRNPLTGLPANLASLRSYRSMRVSSEDRKGNADMRRIEGGATYVAAELEGPGEITHLWTTIATPNPNHLRDIIIRIYWDGNSYPSVESPIGDFYGLGHAKYYIFDNPVQAIGSDKGMNAFWPMPFAKSAKVTITNESDVPVDAYYYYVDWRKFDTMPQSLGYFHAQYHQAHPNENGKPYLIMDTDGGRGHFCGVSLSIHTLVGGWWGEGDDIFTVDGEATPSLWGTGSEDYFCGAWCYRETFYNNYFGMPLRSKMSHDADNFWNVYRLHLESPITFKQSLKVEIEHGANGFDNTRSITNNNYSSVAYWYVDSPRPLKGQLAPRDQRISHYSPPKAKPGVLEFNQMKYATSSGGVEAEAQAMGPFQLEGRKWENEDQLWIRNLNKDQQFELTFENKEPLSGESVLRVTKASDYAKVKVLLDGKQLASYDGYEEKVQPALISIGERKLEPGKHTITVIGNGKNESAKNTYIGIDYLRIGEKAPADETAGVVVKSSTRKTEDSSSDSSERPRGRSNTRRR